MLALYRALTWLTHPIVPCYLATRAAHGKEEPARMQEHLGIASLPRAPGPLVWVHAASVGESLSVLPLLAAWRSEGASILVTTGTVTSAALLQSRLPEGVMHQFAPLDTPLIAKRFLRHWQPTVALWVESELWPGLLLATHRTGCRMALVNARMSARSFRRWKRAPRMATHILSVFDAVFPQTEKDATRFAALGVPPMRVHLLGNLKEDAPSLEADPQALEALHAALAGRPCWLAASLHPGEEEVIAAAHHALAARLPGLVTIVAPRHPTRGREMHTTFSRLGCRVTQRSTDGLPTADTSLYLADTMGELGLFYRLCPVVCMGGSFIPHGGQNPLEPARLGCAVLSGPSMENFAEAHAGLREAGGLFECVDTKALIEHLSTLLTHPSHAHTAGEQGRAWADARRGATLRLLAHLRPWISVH